MAAARVKKDPNPITYRKVPAALGGKGRVALYDRRSGLPELVDEFPEEVSAAFYWVLVHFPSRRAVLIKSRKAALDYLKGVADGVDSLGLCREPQPLPESAEKPRTRGRASKTDGKPEAKAPEKPEDEETEPPKQKTEDGTTAVPEGATFDQAMQSVFSAGRIMGELERLLRAEKTWVNGAGDMESAPDYAVQLNTVKTIISYHQGRPPEKEKPPKEKPKMSLEELKTLLLTSKEARAYMQNLLTEVAAATDATNPAPPAVKVAQLRGAGT